MSKKKLLFIDDNALTCKYFKLATSDKYEVTTAESIEDAKRLIDSQEKFEIVISDYKFDNHEGESNGIELLNRIIAKKKNCFLAICSAYDEIAGSLNAENSRIIFLRKPLDYAVLNAKIDEYFNEGTFKTPPPPILHYPLLSFGSLFVISCFLIFTMVR